MVVETLVAMGVVTTFGAVAALLTMKVAERIIEEAEKMEEKDYVYMNDGTEVEYNEDDQE